MHGLQINSNHILYILTGSLLFLASGFLVLSFLSPFAVDNSYATTETTQNGDYYLETTSTDLNLTIHTTPAGAEESASHDVVVKTDDPTGYTLSVSVNNDTSNALNLNGNTAATTKFPATGGTYVSPKALDDNSWGFTDTLTKKNNNEWAVVPLLSNAQQLKQTSSTNTTGDTTTMYYAINAKYDSSRADGSYSNIITYSVVGNTPPDNTLGGATYMQDSNIANRCASSEATTSSSNIHTYELTDIRNNEPYYIRKFRTSAAHQYCIMVENIYLPSGTKLSPDTTNNIPSEYTLPSTSWDTSGKTPSVGNGSRYRKTGNLDGSYYNWCAATANTGGCYGTNKTATGSICPRYWRLPTYAEMGYLDAYIDDTAGISTFFSDKDGNPNTAIYVGRYGTGTSPFGMTGVVTEWWSSTQGYGEYVADSAGWLQAYGSLSTTATITKLMGVSVRCLVQAAS